MAADLVARTGLFTTSRDTGSAITNTIIVAIAVDQTKALNASAILGTFSSSRTIDIILTSINTDGLFANTTIETIDIGLAFGGFDTEACHDIAVLSGPTSRHTTSVTTLALDTDLASVTIGVVGTTIHAFAT